MLPSLSRLGLATFLTAAILMAIFGTTVVNFRSELRAEIRQKIIERDAAVLHPFALQQLAERESTAPNSPAALSQLLTAVLKSAELRGMLAVTIFDADGNPLESVPKTLLLPELPADDYRRLAGLTTVSRYYPRFPLEKFFRGVASAHGEMPVLEILLPLHGRDPTQLFGFAQYYVDGRPLAGELAVIDGRIHRQTIATLAIGTTLIALVMLAAYLGLRRAQRVIAERNERLTRTNFELTLAVKASALGQITSHLIHGLQGPVAGLRAAMAGGNSASDWQTASDYTERLQALIHETVALLGDTGSRTSYELSGRELADTIRDRNANNARARQVRLVVSENFPSTLDSHRGSILCLIASNLVQNALAATDPGDRVDVALTGDSHELVLTVADEGCGIPEEIRAHLFEPGRSGREGGSGLGLAISQLLARQIEANLTLVRSDPQGSQFRLSLTNSSTKPVTPRAA